MSDNEDLKAPKDLIPTGLYLRVSSDMQVSEHSLDSQEITGRRWSDQNGCVIYKVYRDEARSGTSRDRPDFQEILRDARAGLIKRIWVHHTWRFSRNTKDAEILDDLMAIGVDVYTTYGKIDRKTATGRYISNIELATGEMLVDRIREDTKRGKYTRASKGLPNFSRPPFGYKWQLVSVTPEKQIRVAQVNNDESAAGDHMTPADAMREAFNEYSSGAHSDISIATLLFKRTGVVFQKDTVSAMLTNPFYAGWVRYRGVSDRKTASGQYARNAKRDFQLTRGEHEALISQDLFDRCQAVRAGRRRHTGAPKSDRVYLLGGQLARCSFCGGTLRAHAVYDRGGAKAYRCTARERGQPCDGSQSYIREASLVPQLDALMAALVMPDDYRQAALELINTDAERQKVEAQRRALEMEKARTMKLYQKGMIPESYLDSEVARITAELAGLVIPSAGKVEHAADILRDMTSVWAAADEQTRADILHTLLDAVIVNPTQKQVAGFKPHPDFAPFFQLSDKLKYVEGLGLFALL